MNKLTISAALVVTLKKIITCIFKLPQGVKEPLQIGFHLSAMVGSGTGGGSGTTGGNSRPPPGGNTQESTSVTFDRKKIVSCQCSCRSSAEWCCHLVALCLHRIHWPDTVKLRAPVSESLSRLQRDQLQKFAQYLISGRLTRLTTLALSRFPLLLNRIWRVTFLLILRIIVR